MLDKVKYNLSFTTGSLFYRESVIAAEIFFKSNDWTKCRDLMITDNLIQAKTMTSNKKITYEVISRLKNLNIRQIEIIVKGTKHEQLTMIWIAICKKYLFIRDFAVEVVREKFLNFDNLLTENDYNIFFNSKVEWHEELEKTTKLTQMKAKQVLFRMLREAGIIEKNNLIIPIIFSKEILSEILSDTTINPSIFPISSGY